MFAARAGEFPAPAASYRHEHVSSARGRPRRIRSSDGSVPARARSALLPHARLAGRRRGSRAGDAAPRLAEARDVPGTLDTPRLAVRDRDERLPGLARTQGAPPPAAADDTGGRSTNEAAA